MRKLGNRYGIAAGLNNLGTVAIAQKDYPAAKSYLEQSLEILQEIGNRLAIAAVFVNLGEIAFTQKAYVQACEYLEHSMAISREIDNRFLLAHGLSSVALAYIQLDKAADPLLQEALRLARDISVPMMLKVLIGFAWSYFERGQPERSAEILSLLLNHPALDINLRHTQLDPLEEKLEATLSPSTLDAALTRGKQWDIDGLTAELELPLEDA